MIVHFDLQNFLVEASGNQVDCMAEKISETVAKKIKDITFESQSRLTHKEKVALISNLCNKTGKKLVELALYMP